MADDRPGGEPTEEPTSRRLQRARAEGQVAHSGELTSSIGFVAATLALLAGAGFLAAELTRLVRLGLERAATGDPAAVRVALEVVLHDVARLSAPVVGAGFVAAAAVGYLQSGGLFTLRPLRPRGEPLNPWAGLARIVSGDALARLVRVLVEIAVVVAVAWWTLAPHVSELLRLGGSRTALAASWTWELAARLLLRVAIAGVVLGVGDYLWTRRRWLARLRMTRAEVKREHKEQEGDPRHKAERLRLRREAHRPGLASSVGTADCVIVGPAAIAVALRFDQARMRAPEVVASGEGQVGLQLLELARQHAVPVHHDEELARALHRLAVGDEVPEALYDPVADVLRATPRRTAEAAE